MSPKLYAKLNRYSGYLQWHLRRLIFRPKDTYRFRLSHALMFDYPFHTILAQNLLNIVPFEANELDFVTNYLKPGMVVLDIGANGGLYSLLSARCVGNAGEVHAFEPGPSEFALLKHNIALNSLINVRANQIALSDKDGTRSLGICSDGAFNSFSQNKLPQQIIKSWIDVDAMTLDTYASENRLKHIDLIKIDVEGAELQVLNGAQRLLRSLTPPPAILCEFSDTTLSAMGTSTPELWQAFEQLGYRLYRYISSNKQLHVAKQNELYLSENLVALVHDKDIIQLQ
jgi:FkbM family methyltransferase